MARMGPQSTSHFFAAARNTKSNRRDYVTSYLDLRLSNQFRSQLQYTEFVKAGLGPQSTLHFFAAARNTQSKPRDYVISNLDLHFAC